jgi:hypothetical protein
VLLLGDGMMKTALKSVLDSPKNTTGYAKWKTVTLAISNGLMRWRLCRFGQRRSAGLNSNSNPTPHVLMALKTTGIEASAEHSVEALWTKRES